MGNISNREIECWKGFLSGDKKAFAQIYNMHVDAMYRYGTKLCRDENMVKDAVQEIFLELYLKRNKSTINPKNLRWYLLVALKHNLIKKLKFVRRQTENSGIDFEPEYSIEDTIIQNESDAEKSNRLKQYLSKLPAGQKEALYLRYNEAMDYPDIARILNISVESVQKQVHRAIKSIRQQLNGQALVLMIMKINRYIKKS